jgi:hypothetical protein
LGFRLQNGEYNNWNVVESISVISGASAENRLSPRGLRIAVLHEQVVAQFLAGRSLAPLVKARGFGMTTECEFRMDHYAPKPSVDSPKGW